MNLNHIIRYALKMSQTPARSVAANFGISPQNFSQRLRRDGFNLEETAAICAFCGCEFEVKASYGGDIFLVKCQ